MILGLIFLPLLAALACMMLRSDRLRRALLVATAAVHAVLTVVCWISPPPLAPGAWVGLDAAGRLFLGITSFLFLAVSVYSAHSLGREARRSQTEQDTGSVFVNAPEAVFTACLLIFLSTMTLVVASQHLGMLWVAVEATTLATAPLIYFHRQASSLEATWKYLLVCSVGIALALLGNFLVVVASTTVGGAEGSLDVPELIARGAQLQPQWLKAAFVFLLVGYGTKMGLVPMHTWLPDAHSEAPSPVSALLSGALLNCAFLGIMRAHAICMSAGIGEFSGQLLIVFGLLSMAVAAAFMVNQPDYKRMLAYSSVEHMGLLALGAGLGGAALFGAMLHAVNHSVVKAALFLVAGNLAAYRTKAIARVGGAVRLLPVSGLLWLAGLFAITGSPPFGTFASEFTMLREAFQQGRAVVAIVALMALTIAFIGMSRAFLGMALGRMPAGLAKVARERLPAILPAIVLLGISMWIGLWIPDGLSSLLKQAADLLGGGSP